MTERRDFLQSNAPIPLGSNSAELAALMAEHSDYLADIAIYLRRQNPDVLATSLVKGTSQLTNAISDLNCHEVVFQVGGKPVEVYKIFAFSTYTETVAMSLLSMANINDGIPFVAGASLDFIIPTHSVYLMLSAIAGGVAPVNCVVNGPASAAQGGFFVYGFTIPDYYRLRGSSRG